MDGYRVGELNEAYIITSSHISHGKKEDMIYTPTSKISPIHSFS